MIKQSTTMLLFLSVNMFLATCSLAPSEADHTAIISTPTPKPTPTAAPDNLISMVSPDEPGEPLTLDITIRDRVTNIPIVGAELWLRQTSDAGTYDEDAAGNPRLQTTVVSDAIGQLKVVTILPGRYPSDPTASRHIHISVTAVGYEPLERVILFDNDPYLTAAERSWDFGIVAPMTPDMAGGWQTAFALTLTATPDDSLQTYTIVPDQSLATYQVEEEFFDQHDWLAAHDLTAGLATAIGATNAISGSLQLDLNQTPPLIGFNRFTVDLMSLTSDQSGRDNAIRRDVFHSGRYGTASYTIQSLSGLTASTPLTEATTFEMLGDMTVRNITRPVTFSVVAQLDGQSIIGEATAELRMSDFGITPPSLLGILAVRDEVLITLVFTLQPSP